jgi:cytochrome c oxidase subunit 3
MNPKKFALWLFMVSVVMIFASLTSAYIVRQAEGNWLFFELPPAFWASSLFIAISSISMQLSYKHAKRDEFNGAKRWLIFTLLLGGVFTVFQFIGWNQLVGQEVFFVGNPAGSFVYVISGMHLVHLGSALIFLLIVLHALSKQKIHSKNMNVMDMCMTYWHFLGALWLYLFLFLVLNR